MTFIVMTSLFNQIKKPPSWDYPLDGGLKKILFNKDYQHCNNQYFKKRSPYELGTSLNHLWKQNPVNPHLPEV